MRSYLDYFQEPKAFKTVTAKVLKVSRSKKEKQWLNQEVVIADEPATGRLTLWQDDIDKLHLVKGYVSLKF